MLKRSLALAAGIALSLSAALRPRRSPERTQGLGDPRRSAHRTAAQVQATRRLSGEALGMPVKFVPVADYAGVVEALAADRLDMAWLGGFTFVQARLKTGNAIPLVQREQDQQFTSKFITADPRGEIPAGPEGQGPSPSARSPPPRAA
ncbi:PhnD/SsuA/transferrin family substrate-binding protein [Pseudomonas aeruginosa]|nr:PhnD/SsuA/transferrin family substrate-binding protein [Pseudomonas aeruginosa]